EFALGAALALSGAGRAAVAGLDTDGSDGPTGLAGGLVDHLSAARAGGLGIDLRAALARHDVRVERDFGPVPPMLAERGKVLQILVNLVSNAKYACDAGLRRDKLITLRVAPGPAGRVRLVVQDNGVGIPDENQTRIFQHGFTTKPKGHGFGLHSSANAAMEMKGTLTVHSDGPGTGATFTLDLPAAAPDAIAANN
ncbi:MAG: hypothetical protein HYV75_10395, partial [Opitutae bacterium]|nr:hypothetical protein [Opitutae bacterium]